MNKTTKKIIGYAMIALTVTGFNIFAVHLIGFLSLVLVSYTILHVQQERVKLTSQILSEV